MNISARKGFTLIELLVVIAIIGILSATVLVSLNAARTKGADAATKKDLSNVRRQAELYVDANGRSYANVCTNTTVNGTKSIYDIIESTASRGGYTLNVNNLAGSATQVTCNDSATEWAVEAPLKTGGAGGNFFCVDFRGIAATTSASTLAAGDTRCN